MAVDHVGDLFADSGRYGVAPPGPPTNTIQSNPEPRAPAQAADTSQAAAAAVKPKKAEADRARIVEYLRNQHGAGATDEEMQHDLSMPPNTQRPRRVELVKDKRVADTGGRRETRAGKRAIVWGLT